MNVLRRKTNQIEFKTIFKKQKHANNETEYVSNILNRLDVAYEQACMANPRDKYYMNMLETLVDYNYCHNAPLSNEKLRQAISTVMSETKEK